MCSSDLFLGLIAILFPPIAVWVKCGICSADSVINILLCCLGYLPGLLHAWYIIAKFPDTSYSEYETVPHDGERGLGRTTYIYVQGPSGRQSQQPKNKQPSPGGHAMNSGAAGAGYGTTTVPLAPNVHQSANGEWSGAGEGSSAAPPSYAQVVGDHKVQSKD